MPDFTIRGNPGAIRSRARTTSDKGQVFYDTGDALSKIDTAGWTGRAADHFRDAHDLEPERWVRAGNGFKTAGAALLTYADAVQDAQATADWAEGEYDRGDQVTDTARSAYDADVADAQQKLAAGVYSSLTIIPFDDPGQAIRDNAVAEFNGAKSTLDNAARTCAGQVRAGCADAPEEPNWLESGLKFVGGIIEGAGEAVWDLLTMIPFSPVNLVIDSYKVATGDLTPEELLTKYELAGESAVDLAKGIYTGLTTDPVGFGKNLGKSLLDWDTWADDPARAIGHLVPDAVVAVATAGTGALATRGAKGGMDALDGLADLNKLDNLADLNKLDNLDDLRHVDLDATTDWSRGGTLDHATPGADNYPPGYDRYGGLGEQSFHDRYWDPDARGGQGGWDYPTKENGFPDGFQGDATPNTAAPGDVVDRYGPADGNYASPAGTPFEERALPPSSVGSDYTRYEVLKPLPSEVLEGQIAPWFEQPGGGLQYKFDHPMSWYEEHGFLKELE